MRSNARPSYVAPSAHAEIVPGMVDLTRDWIARADAATLFRELFASLAWADEVVTGQCGEAVVSPKRRTCVYGDDGLAYSYSGTAKVASAWHPALVPIRDRLRSELGQPFNFCLCNLYADGTKSIGLHSDDERDLASSSIASVSLGATRTFVLQGKGNEDDRHSVRLASGALLLMHGRCQERYRHTVPPEEGILEPRINLTFRVVRVEVPPPVGMLQFVTPEPEAPAHVEQCELVGKKKPRNRRIVPGAARK